MCCQNSWTQWGHFEFSQIDSRVCLWVKYIWMKISVGTDCLFSVWQIHSSCSFCVAATRRGWQTKITLHIRVTRERRDQMVLNVHIVFRYWLSFNGVGHKDWCQHQRHKNQEVVVQLFPKWTHVGPLFSTTGLDKGLF